MNGSRRTALVASLAAFGTLTAAIAIQAQQPGESPSAESAVPIPPGQIDKAVAKLDGVIAETMRRTGVPGVAVAVVHNDAVVYSKGFGVRRVGSGQPVDQNTIFQLASVSKPLGATAIARAVGQGRLRWDDPVVKYLPRFRLKSRSTTRQVTIADLYSHRSGLGDHVGDLLETLFGYGRSEILRRLRYAPLEPLRAEYAYNNYGITVAGVAAARAAGRSWADFARRTLYRPLGMTSTSSRFADYARAPNRASIHARVGNHWEAKFVRTPDPQSPAGGASSNVVDLAKWMRLYLAQGTLGGRQVIAPGAFAEMRTPHSFLAPPPAAPDDRPALAALGIDTSVAATGRTRFSHSGAFVSGVSTTVRMLPAEKLGIVVLSNGQPVGAPEAISETFMDLAELGKPLRDWLPLAARVTGFVYVNPSRLVGRQRPTAPRPARRRSAYTGRYTNGFAGPIRVTTRRGRLTVLLGPRRRPFALSHWRGNTFSYLPTGEDSVGISAVTFRFRRGGRRAATVRLENLGDLGTLRRR